MSSLQSCPLVSSEESSVQKTEGVGEDEGIELENIQVDDSKESTQTGLTSDEAYKRLCEIIQHELLVFNHTNNVSWTRNFLTMLANNDLRSSFSWTSLLFILIEISLLLLGSLLHETRMLSLLELAIILVVTTTNIILCVKEEHLRKTEVSRKIDFKKKRSWDTGSYPDLTTPSTDSLSLAWTYRNNKLVNVPSNLLVNGDIIVLAPGQKFPAKAQQLLPNSGKTFPVGELFCTEFVDKGNQSFDHKILPSDPCPRQRFLVIEAPLKEHLQKTFHSCQRKRMTLMENQRYYVLKQIVEYKLIPITIVASFVVNMLRYILSKNECGHWSEMFLTLQAYVVIPLLPLVFPLMWIVINCYGTARIQALFHIQSDPLSKTRSLRFSDVRHFFWDNIKGEPDCLTRTSSILHTLGSISVWCCVDKDGILALPNPYAEKVFFFRKKKEKRHKRSSKHHHNADGEETDFTSASMIDDDHDCSHPASPDVNFHRNEDEAKRDDDVSHLSHKEFTLASHSEVLNLTCDPQSEFGIIFDDYRWQRHLSSLKPLGLNVLLNSPCSAPDEAVRLSDHLGHISLLVNDTPVRVIRRCLCLLGKQIGFIDSALTTFQKKQNIFAFRANQHLNDSLIQSHSFLSVCKEIPIPFLTSLVVEHIPSGTYQLLSQGSADLLLDVCTDFWDGSEVHSLTTLERKKIRDFFNRTSITSNCVALSYRPINKPWQGSPHDVFLEIPEDVQWEYSDSDNGSMSSSKSSSSSGDEDTKCEQSSHLLQKNDDAIDLDFYQRIIGSQIFIGMITLQHQAKQDIPPLVEDLDNAGIRFVHFSEENEIKSRVFAERLGLETGWNCHISFSEKSAGFDEHSTVTGGSDGKVEETVDEFDISHRMSAHFEDTEIEMTKPDVVEVEREKEGEEMVVGILTGHGEDVVDMEIGEDEEVEKRVKWCDNEDNRERKNSDSSSSSSSSNNEHLDITDAGFWVSGNRAKLPRGIENIRPHLQHVDNVPLLVPLFTDCTPEATREMIEIMQEYGEVVCCIGSSLNVANVGIFNQADISIAIQPTFPQLCLKENTRLYGSQSSSMVAATSCETDVLLRCTRGHITSHVQDLTPLEVSSTLNGISCSLSFVRDYEMKFVSLLKENWIAHKALRMKPQEMTNWEYQDGRHGNIDNIVEGRKQTNRDPCFNHTLTNTVEYRNTFPIFNSNEWRLLTALILLIFICPCFIMSLIIRILSWAFIFLARRFCFGLHNCFNFMLSCQLTLSVVMFAASCFMLPPPLSGIHLLWFSCLIVPLLSITLVNASPEPELMTMMTAKNDKNFGGSVWSFLRFFGVAFAPSVLISDLLIFPLTLISFCQRVSSSTNDECRYFHGNRNNTEYWNGFGETYLQGLALAQDSVAFFLMLCFVFMSTSYVHRLHPLWRRSPFFNKQWIAAVFIVIILQVVYTSVSQVAWRSQGNTQTDFGVSHLPTSVLCFMFLWPIMQLIFCELLKRKYIKSNIRYQKRAKLKFGTKLGMNSPF